MFSVPLNVPFFSIIVKTRHFQVTFDASVVGFPALIGLGDFSHVWLLFVFHDNTNATVNGVVAEERPAADAAADATLPAASAAAKTAVSSNGAEEAPPVGDFLVNGEEKEAEAEGKEEAAGGWNGGIREYHLPKHKIRQNFLTKVW